MVIDIILLTLAFVALVIGTITDLKTREVPDWLSFSLIFSGIGLRLLYSVMTFDWMYLIEGILGLLVFVAFGYLMFYAGQWGGGDSKMLMGIGSLIGLKLNLEPFPLLAVFFINILLAGGIYGLIYGTALAIIHRKKFSEELKKIKNSPKIILTRKIFLIASIVLIILALVFANDFLLSTIIVCIVLLAYISFYMILLMKAVELAAMYRYVSPSELTEGDWIAKDIVINKKRIAGPKDLGIEKKQLDQLIRFKQQGKLKKVLIKVGIPFVPSFLIAFVLSLSFGAWWMGLF